MQQALSADCRQVMPCFANEQVAPRRLCSHMFAGPIASIVTLLPQSYQ